MKHQETAKTALAYFDGLNEGRREGINMAITIFYVLAIAFIILGFFLA